jgi:uncharacterized protein YndB with AHSA1/START domain
MRTQATIEIAASAERVWEVFADVRRWPTWTRSVTSIDPLDAPDVAVGHRFRIKQPKLPALVWQVTEVDAPRSWTWVARSPGATTIAVHHVISRGESASVVTQTIDQRGPLGVIAAVLTRQLVLRYLALEGEGLKSASETGDLGAAQP